MFQIKKNYPALLLLLVGLTLLCIGQSSSAVTLVLDKTEYASGEAIVAVFADGPGNKKDWIGLYAQGTSPGSGSAQAFLYVDGSCNGRRAKTNGTVTFDSAESCFVSWPLAPGNYKAYFCENDGYNILDGPVSFTVTGSGATFTLDKMTFYEGETITATFMGAPGNATDWMGLYTTPNGGAPSDCTNNGGSLAWNYTDGMVNGSVSINTPYDFAGNHVVHLLANGGYCDIAPPVNITVLSGPTSSLTGPGGGKKVLFIMMDGVRGDTLQIANTPNIDYLIANGAYDSSASTTSATFSGAGWADLMCGVGQNKHNVTSNSYTNDVNFKDWVSFLDILETEDPSINTASVTSWDLCHAAITHNIDHRVMHDCYALGYSTADVRVKNDAVSIISTKDVDAIFVPFVTTDETGHAYGTLSQENIDAIEVIDGQIGDLIDAVEGRSTFASEDWLILVGTDHGRTDAGGHGGTSPDEKWVFFIASGTGSDQGTTLTNCTNVDFAATAITHMLGSVPAGWNLDGQAKGLCTSGCGGSCTATDMHIESVVCSEVSCGGPNRSGRATVTIFDDCSSPVANALVTVTFGGDFSETVYDVATGANGQAVLDTSNCVKNPAFTVTVDSVVHGTLSHDSNDDVETGCSG